MAIDMKDLKTQLTDEHIIKIVRSLGSAPPIIENKDILVFQTICHNPPSQSNKFKLYYYKNTQLFRCYTGCDDRFDIFQLIAQAKEIQEKVKWTIQECISYVLDICDLAFGYTASDYNKNNDWGFLDKYLEARKEKTLHTELEEYDPVVMDVFQDWYYKGWKNEGILTETMKKFSIKYWSKENQIIIPHYDIDNRLIGIRARNLNQDAVEKGFKYMPVLVENTRYRHNTSLNLYGLNIVKNEIQKTKKVILFEGEKSCMISHSIYGENSIACAVSGSNIFKVQRDFLVELGVNEVTIAFDKQFENLKERGRYFEHLQNVGSILTPYMTTYIIIDKEDILDFKDSPIDKGKEVFEQLMNKRILLKE